MDRRDILKVGALTGGSLGLGAVGCGAVLEGMTSVPVPSIAELQALDIDGFLKRLDTSLGYIQSSSTLAALVKHDVAAHAGSDARFEHADGLVRKTLRTLLLTSSFKDLDEAGRLHPGVQARLCASMAEMDEAVLGMNKLTTSFTPTERADLQRELRDDPTLGPRILKALDEEGEKAGVNEVRRKHLQDVGKAALFRLRQSTSTFIDEYDEKLTKVAARDMTVEAIRRRMMAVMGEDAFWQYHARQVALQAAWRKVPGVAQAASPPAPTDWSTVTFSRVPVGATASTPPSVASTSPVQKSHVDEEGPDLSNSVRGGIVLSVGGAVLGFAALFGLGGLVLVLGFPYDQGRTIAALFLFTAAALNCLAGIILVIVGAVIRGHG